MKLYFVLPFYHRIPYPEIFGGVTIFAPQEFMVVNGFSNEFYGWGGEDDDMFNRLVDQWVGWQTGDE